MDFVVEIVGILVGVGFPVSLVAIYLILNYRRRRHLMELYHAERMAAIERGLELPPLPLELLDGRRRRSTSLLPGLVWFFVGISVMIALRASTDSSGMIGLVPAAIGLAYLIYYFAEGRKLETRQFVQELPKPREINA
ncbi:MAG TPA: DUF6249 domain-containing protein [Steroidobacteraceae bacterium]